MCFQKGNLSKTNNSTVNTGMMTHSFFAHLKQRAERSPVIVSNGEGLSTHLFCMPLWSSFTPKKMAPTTRARKMFTPSCTGEKIPQSTEGMRSAAPELPHDIRNQCRRSQEAADVNVDFAGCFNHHSKASCEENHALKTLCKPAKVWGTERKVKQNPPSHVSGDQGSSGRGGPPAPPPDRPISLERRWGCGGWWGGGVGQGGGGDREERKSATCFKLCNLQTMTGQSGSQGEGISGYAWTSFPAAPHVKAGQWSDRSWRHHVMSPRSGPRGSGQIWYQFRSRPKEAWVGSQQSHKPIRAPTPPRAPLVGLFFDLFRAN